MRFHCQNLSYFESNDMSTMTVYSKRPFIFGVRRWNIYYVQGWRNDSRGGGGTSPWEPPRKRVHKCLKGPKTTYTTIAIAEKQSKRGKKGPIFVIYRSPPGTTQKMKLKLMGPGGEGPSRSPPPPVSPAMTRWSSSRGDRLNGLRELG